MVQPSANKNPNKDHLPPLIIPQSSEFSLMRENTQAQLDLIKEPAKSVATQKQVEKNKPRLVDTSDEFDKQIHGFFVEPMQQSETKVEEPGKKEETLVITTEQTEAMFKNH